MRRALRTAAALLAVTGLVALSACAVAPEGTVGASSALNEHPSEDWPIAEIDEATEVYALSDVHGGYEQLGRLLESSGLITGFSTNDAAKWVKPGVILVVAGDLIDKGADSLAVIDLLMSLETSSKDVGSRVVVTMGNHEAEFLDDPLNDKALAVSDDGVGISVQLQAKHIDPKSVSSGTDLRGAWLRKLPFAVRIKKWFFSHGGNTEGDTMEELRTRLQKGFEKDGFGSKHITGKDSILEAQQWYEKGKGKDYAKKLGVKHLVFGHDPGALDDRGRILAAQDDSLIKVNVNMGLAHESKALVEGALLHVTIVPDAPDHAEVITGTKTESLF